MDDVTHGDPSSVAPASPLRARFASAGIPGWARRPGASPRLLARGLMRHAGAELLPATFAPVLLTLAALWAGKERPHLTAVALLCETLAIAHVGFCLLSSTASDPALLAEPEGDDGLEAVVVVSRLVGVIALVVACGALVPLASLAGARLVLLAAGGFALAMLAIAARLWVARDIPINALLALALGPGVALAVVYTQGGALTGGLVLLTGGTGALFAVLLAERRASTDDAAASAEPSFAQTLARAGLAILICAGFLAACLAAFTGRPFAGSVVGLLALPFVLVAATSVIRARGQRAVSLAAMKILSAHWLLSALILVGLVGWGALNRWVF